MAAAQRQVVMRTEFGFRDMVADRLVLGLIPRQALPQIATDALEAGLAAQARNAPVVTALVAGGAGPSTPIRSAA